MTYIDDFSLLRRFLEGGGLIDSNVGGSLKLACSRRLVEALQTGSAFTADVAALIRHVLRRESERTGTSQQLLVPQGSSWPTIEEWCRHGIRAIPHATGFFRVEAQRWSPFWLKLAAGISPETDTFAECPRRQIERCPGDPFLSTLGLKDRQYLTVGQKEAVRAVLTAPQGSTLIVNLPTGTGKSLCAQVLSRIPYVDGKEGGVTVVVVPTVALALDQERNAEEILGLKYPTAYRWSNDNEGRVKTREIWRRVSDGTQSIVFVSPESLMGSLRPALYYAARKQLLKALVIDEAHIVDQWGECFRPSFQEIPGLRRALLRTCPSLRTVLMSATLTESSLVTIENLFSEPEHGLCMISAVQLRPEPSYWFAHCSDWGEKESRILEAVDHLPRPMILYTTEREHAYWWRDKLVEHGYKRLAVMTGKTASDEREKIIQQWAQSKIDIVVGTSAFGLGVDKRDVRAVVHACVPETLDRFYQEVGRTGRDGNASISIAIYTDRDIGIARTTNKTRNITVSKGLARWKNMFENKIDQPGGNDFLITVPINVGRKLEHDPESTRNVEWNVRTLTLMSRVGLIELHDAPTDPSDEPRPDIEISQESSILTDQTNHLRRTVRITNSNHLSESLWKDRVEPVRDKSQSTAANQFQLLQSLLSGEECASQIIARAYVAPFPSTQPQPTTVPVARSCGGCAHCRSEGRTAYVDEPLVRSISWPSIATISLALARYLMGSKVLAVFFNSSEENKQLFKSQAKLFNWLLGEGIRCLVAPKEMANDLCEATPRVKALPVFVENEYEPMHLPPVPTVLFHTHEQLIASDLLERWVSRMSERESRAPLVLVLLDIACEPERTDRLLSEVLPCPRVNFDELRRLEVL